MERIEYLKVYTAGLVLALLPYMILLLAGVVKHIWKILFAGLVGVVPQMVEQGVMTHEITSMTKDIFMSGGSDLLRISN